MLLRPLSLVSNQIASIRPFGATAWAAIQCQWVAIAGSSFTRTGAENVCPPSTLRTMLTSIGSKPSIATAAST